MSPSAPKYATLDEWIAREAIPFSLDSPESLNPAIDKLMAALGNYVELLGLGEALHGGEEFLILRNRLFQRLVQSHGFSAIAVESSFPRANVANEYVAGRGGASYEEIQEAGFSHGFGKLAANRELIEWMRSYNADQKNPVKLQFYGFDSPTEMMFTDSPRQLLYFALDYLESIDSAGAKSAASASNHCLAKIQPGKIRLQTSIPRNRSVRPRPPPRCASKPKTLSPNCKFAAQN